MVMNGFESILNKEVEVVVFFLFGILVDAALIERYPLAMQVVVFFLFGRSVAGPLPVTYWVVRNVVVVFFLFGHSPP